MREDTDLIAMITDKSVAKKQEKTYRSLHNIEIMMRQDFQGTIQIKSDSVEEVSAQWSYLN